tara:strand:- start:629 stop:1366 length:738 start_codon:yes stop_codon:yes gene_type:complete
MKNTYGYIRVSTNQQVETGMSLKEQERQIKSYAQLKNLKIKKIFTERGVSAGVELIKRPCGKQLLSIVEDGDVIISSKLDRMFRSTLDGLQVCKELKDRNVALHFIDIGGNVTTNGDDNGIGKVVFTVMSSFAEMERNRLGERIRGTKQLQMKQNVYLGGRVGFGYTLVQIEDKTYVLENVEQQRIIEKMKMLRKEGLSYRKIEDAIKKDRVTLSHTSIRYILETEKMQKTKLKKVKETIKRIKK